MEKRIDRVFTTQNGIGKKYARTKTFRKANLIDKFDDEEFKKKNLKVLREHVLKNLSVPFSAVISPRGEVFIIDGHHDLYGAVIAELDLHETQIKLDIVKNYQEDGYSEERFIEDMVEKKWADREAINGRPLLITEILDDVERSFSGLALLAICDTYKIPFIGKSFIPRVQFELMDLVRDKKLFNFDGNLTEKNINDFANLIVTHQKILKFWLQSLNRDAAKSLRDFLSKQLELSQDK